MILGCFAVIIVGPYEEKMDLFIGDCQTKGSACSGEDETFAESTSCMEQMGSFD